MEHSSEDRSHITRCQSKYITRSSSGIKVELCVAHFTFAPVVDFSATHMVQRSLEETHMPTGSEGNGSSVIEDDSCEGGWTA